MDASVVVDTGPIVAMLDIRVYEERFERTYRFFRPYLRKVIYRYLDCGDLHNGFSWVKCRLQVVILTSFLY